MPIRQPLRLPRGRIIHSAPNKAWHGIAFVAHAQFLVIQQIECEEWKSKRLTELKRLRHAPRNQLLNLWQEAQSLPEPPKNQPHGRLGPFQEFPDIQIGPYRAQDAVTEGLCSRRTKWPCKNN